MKKNHVIIRCEGPPKPKIKTAMTTIKREVSDSMNTSTKTKQLYKIFPQKKGTTTMKSQKKSNSTQVRWWYCHCEEEQLTQGSCSLHRHMYTTSTIHRCHIVRILRSRVHIHSCINIDIIVYIIIRVLIHLYRVYHLTFFFFKIVL